LKGQLAGHAEESDKWRTVESNNETLKSKLEIIQYLIFWFLVRNNCDSSLEVHYFDGGK
jgi:hypothetical protein